MVADFRVKIRRQLLSAVVIGSCLAVLGCQASNPAVQRSQQAADVLVDTRQSLGASEQAVAESQTALRTLGQSKGDLRPPFAAFVTQLEAVRKQADRQRQESDFVLMQATAYSAARQKDISTISNDELRKAAEARAAHMQQQCQTMKDLYGKMNAAFGVYLANLTDLQTYLANDLNYGALNSAQRWVDQSNTSGEALREDIRALAAQVELMSNALSPVPIASSKWPTTLQTTSQPANP